MFQYTCGFDSCQKLTSFANGDCWYCLQHLCDEHIAAEFHPCLFPGVCPFQNTLPFKIVA